MRKYYKKTKLKRLVAATCVVLMAGVLDEEACSPKTRTPRRMWIKDWIARRKEQGIYHNLFKELALSDPNMYRRCLRLDTHSFEELLTLVTPAIKKEDTNWRESISAEEQLSVVLRHLATGETQMSLALAFRLGQSTISEMIEPVCKAIYSVLADDYLKTPSTEEEWMIISDRFYIRWNFPNCLGAVDGKHVLIDPPINSGALFYNYKGEYSINLMAVVDADLKFVYVDVGTNGRANDGGVWAKCSFKKAIDTNSINIPPPQAIPDTDEVIPFVLVTDDAFPLTINSMKPYTMSDLPGHFDRRIYNYRLSRARRCSENGFGILSNRFLIFRAAMRYDPEKATTIVLAAVALHNWLRTKVVGRAVYNPPGYVDEENAHTGDVQPGLWRESGPCMGMKPYQQLTGNRHATTAIKIRSVLCEYFSGVGAVPWQTNSVRKS